MGLVSVPASISVLFTKNSKQKTQIQEKFADIFIGIGKLPVEVTIHVKENSVPSVNPVCIIPFALHERVKSELDRLECLDIIEKVTTPMLLSGLIRLCQLKSQTDCYDYIWTQESLIKQYKGPSTQCQPLKILQPILIAIISF